MRSVITGIAAFALVFAGAIGWAGDRADLEGAEYTVSIEKRGAVFLVKTEGKAGYHCNTMYPWKLTVTGGTGETILKKNDAKRFEEESVVFSVRAETAKKGNLKMSVCNDQQCIMKTVPLSFGLAKK